jgi:predicted ATPase/DNA-binding SARP family transcriptional activator
MDFQILGPLRVRSKNGDLELGSPAQRALLAVLLTSPDVPLSDDRLIDELWGEDPPTSAHHLLQVYVSRLRGVLDEPSQGPRIVRDGVGYVLRVGPREIDAERFVAAVARGRGLQDSDPETADHVLSRAMRLWRGPPFADLTEVPSAVRDEAQHLERQYLEALQTWIEVRLQLGQHRELVPELAMLVARHPYDEALHADLMLAQYRCGRQAEALATARALRDRLREDLGVDASARVRDLYHQILLQAPQLAPEPAAPPGNLPDRLTSFVGRTLEVRAVAGLLDAARLVTLTGPGGIGKTRLAIEVADQLRSWFPGGTWWLDLAPVTDPETILAELARVLDLSGPPGADLVKVVARRLGGRPALLLMDNCEHMATTVAGLVSEILRAAPGLRVLATSRIALRIEGEQVWIVPPLGMVTGDGGSVDPTASDAVRLFVERGRSADPSFSLDEGNAAAVTEVCRRLDGLALAIEMAAARLTVLTPAEIALRLDERFALLELPATGRLSRHRTLEAAFDASYTLMSEHQRRAFERLSVFAGPFDLDAFSAVAFVDGEPAEPPLATVTGLVGASMLAAERDGERTRYRLLESLRAYSAARLRERGDDDDARRAHARYYLDLFEGAGDVVNTPDLAPWMERLSQGYPELREALDWSLSDLDPATTLRAVPALFGFWYRRGDALEAARWTTRMLEADLRAVPGGLVAEVHAAAAFASVMANDLSTARPHAEEAVRRAREAADPRALAAARWTQASTALALGDVDTVRRCATEELSACEERGDRWGRAWPLTSLGMVSLLFGGSLEEARARFEEALPLYRALADPANLVLMTLTPLCLIALRQGDLPAAERWAIEAMELGRGTGWEAAGAVFYAEVLAETGDLTTADTFTRRALQVALDWGQENWFRWALRDLARTAALRDRCERAAVLLAASRCNMPAYGLDPAIYGPVEERCRRALGDDRFARLWLRGEAMDHDQLVDLVGADDASR